MAAHQTPPSMGFSRQEYWSGVPLPSLGKKVDLCPNTDFKDSSGPWMVLKENHWGKGSESSFIFPCAKSSFWLVGGEVTEWSSRSIVLSLKLPSSPWVGALVPAEELKDVVIYIPWRRSQDPAPLLHYCFLTATSLFLHFLPSLISNCLNLPFETQGRSVEAEWNLLNKKWGHRKGLYTGGPHRILLSFIKNPKVLDWIQNEWEIITHTHRHHSYFYSEARSDGHIRCPEGLGFWVPSSLKWNQGWFPCLDWESTRWARNLLQEVLKAWWTHAERTCISFHWPNLGQSGYQIMIVTDCNLLGKIEIHESMLI